MPPVENLMEQSITINSLLHNPWVIGISIFLCWWLGGLVFQNWLAKSWTKSDGYIAKEECEEIMVLRFFFPFSVVLYSIYRLGVWFKKRQITSIQQTAEKAKKDNKC